MTIAPLHRHVPVAPDADWETVRSRVVAALATAAPHDQSDHNPIDPGITLAEAGAFTMADLHYRADCRTLQDWPLAGRTWEAAPARHWHTTLPLAQPPAAGNAATPLTELAQALAQDVGGRPRAHALADVAMRARSRTDARDIASEPPDLVAGLDEDLVHAAITLVRAPVVLRAALEHTDIVAAAVDAHRDRPGTVAERDAAAADTLALDLDLWPEELAALVRRERRRRTVDTVASAGAALRTATAATSPDVVGGLLTQGLTAAEALVARGLAHVPPDMMPEDFERADGDTLVWPPHPLQALTCEPVTGPDYARLARTAPGVTRAWTVAGRLAGIAWDGTAHTLSEPEAMGAVTIVVEAEGPRPEHGAALTPSRLEFLRTVLERAIGPEVRTPHSTLADDLDGLEPRRLLCEEVGATLLRESPVTVKATLVTGTDVDSDAVVAAAAERIERHFEQGRPESRRAPESGPAVEGPWPRVDQRVDGWNPGEDVRFTEVVQVIAEDAAIVGIEGLAMRAGAGPWFDSGDGALPIPVDSVPVLADRRCLSVRLVLRSECGHD